MSRAVMVVAVALLACVGGAAAEDVYLEPADFLAEAFGGDVPEPDVVWITKSLKADVTEILGHRPGSRRIRYWQSGTRTAWILEEIGKVEPITTGYIVDGGRIDRVQVLIYRESRGWEVRYPFFTDQFRGVSLDGSLRLNASIDGISGATLSVRALISLARLALYCIDMSWIRKGAKTRRSSRGALYRWHRRVGLVAGLIMVVVAVTGIVLNHHQSLSLADRAVGADWLLTWYGVDAPEMIEGYGTGAGWVSNVGDRWYLDAEPLEDGGGALRGAVAADELLVVAAPTALWLFDSDGDLIEKLPVPGDGTEIAALGLRDNGAAVETDMGRFIADAAMITWSPLADPIDVSAPETVPQDLYETLVEAYRGDGLPLDRVLLDLHSGRIFGPAGPYVFDAAAIALLFLAVSGVINWAGRGAIRRLFTRKR